MAIVPTPAQAVTRPPHKSLADCLCGRDHLAIAVARIDWGGDCWHWLLKPNPSGYGAIWHGKKSWMAHRFTYEALCGPIPAGLTLDHLCRNRICVNPDHLEPVTYEENTARGMGAVLSRAARMGKYTAPPDPLTRRAYLSRREVGPDDPRHGTDCGYQNLKCRCRPCRDAHAAATRERRHRQRAA